jgi:prepilin-type N-terminal cleavage/methylation domain-containing protein
MRGFSLIEMMIALVVVAFGLLTAGQMLFTAASSTSLARSKGTAAIVAQNRLESLAILYLRDPSAADLAFGAHGPWPAVIANPTNGTVLNRYAVVWNVSPVPDPRPGVTLNSRLVEVRVTPILQAGADNSKPAMNKILNISTILGLRAQ